MDNILGPNDDGRPVCDQCGKKMMVEHGGTYCPDCNRVAVKVVMPAPRVAHICIKRPAEKIDIKFTV